MILREIANRDGMNLSQFIAPFFQNCYGVNLDTINVTSTDLAVYEAAFTTPDAMDCLSSVAISNLYMMAIASEKDSRQRIPPRPYTPPESIRKLRAQLILEEAFETVQALGFNVYADSQQLTKTNLQFVADFDPNVEEVIDGCCDTVYVAIGTLMSFGVPDLPHLDHVNAANNSKFPNGVALTNTDGKVIKPEGWVPPNHENLKKEYQTPNLQEIGKHLVESSKKLPIL
jgi:predicted HAD superfamily Cof-like phosphohydrolase